MNNEIEALKLALQSSPNNLELKKIIHAKMCIDRLTYNEELFKLSKDIHDIDRTYIPAVESLIRHYFENNKLSTSELILENYPEYEVFSEEGLITICKLLIKLKQQDRASDIYKMIIERNPGFLDDDLDPLFRVSQVESTGDKKETPFLQKPKETFKDVGGMSDVKREISLKIIKPLENKSLFEKYGKKIGGGILLYGPPGCGKTFIARATAGEIEAKFISLQINDILSMWLGNSEKNLHELFQLAREHTPAVIFIDEIDALGMKRSNFNSSAGRNVVNQLLTEMDGVENNNDGVLIIGATNSPWELDSALRRPGRFDRIIFVPPPDKESRETILKLKLKDKPIDRIDYRLLADRTSGYSGADIDAVIDVAIENILEKAIETGNTPLITDRDLLTALKHRNPSTREWFNTVKNYTTFSNKSGIYDDVITYMKANKIL